MYFFVSLKYDGLRRLFHNALNENNLVNDGDFDWVRRLQEHRLNRSKTATNNNHNTTTTTQPTTTGVLTNTNKISNTNPSTPIIQTPASRTMNFHSTTTNNNNNYSDSRQRSLNNQKTVAINNKSFNESNNSHVKWRFENDTFNGKYEQNLDDNRLVIVSSIN